MDLRSVTSFVLLLPLLLVSGRRGTAQVAPVPYMSVAAQDVGTVAAQPTRSPSTFVERSMWAGLGGLVGLAIAAPIKNPEDWVGPTAFAVGCAGGALLVTAAREGMRPLGVVTGTLAGVALQAVLLQAADGPNADGSKPLYLIGAVVSVPLGAAAGHLLFGH